MDFEVSGPQILFEIPIFGGIPVSETIVVMWAVMAILLIVFFFITRDLKVKPTSKRQIIAEQIVGFFTGLVEESMGKKWLWFTPYIASLLLVSCLSSLSGLLGIKAPTSDYSVILAWAIATFLMVQGTGIKSKGIIGYGKGFMEPIPLLFPINIISEVATPISMSFRHFGNIAAGSIIMGLIYASLAVLSSAILQYIPIAVIQTIPIFQVGIPAVLSVYFDVFGSVLQAYIFSMLTMVFISGAE